MRCSSLQIILVCDIIPWFVGYIWILLLDTTNNDEASRTPECVFGDEEAVNLSECKNFSKTKFGKI